MKKSFLLFITLFLFLSGMSSVAAYNYYNGHEKGVVVLMYHDFGYSNNPKIINAEVFEDQMAALAASNYDVISMDQFIAYTEGRLILDKKSVLITFDDGYEDFYLTAFPVLKKYNLPATNFIIVSKTDKPNEKALPHLTWDQMREMQQYGQSFYNHTYNHHLYLDPGENEHAALVSLKENETEEKYIGRVKSDLSYAHKLLVKELGEQPNILAFPYGRYSDELLEICHEIGIDYTFGITPGINDENTKVYHRVNAGLSRLRGEDLLRLIKRQ